MKKIGVIIICFVLVYAFCVAGHFYNENQNWQENGSLIIFSPKTFLESFASVDFPAVDVVSLLNLSVDIEGDLVDESFIENYIKDNYGWFNQSSKLAAFRSVCAVYIGSNGATVNTLSLRGFDFTPAMIDETGVLFSYERTTSPNDILDFFVCFPPFVAGLIKACFNVFLTLLPWNNARAINVEGFGV